MKEEEKAENNVDARRIITEVLNELGLSAPKFAERIGINYQRVFDLQRGRTKKFNPGVANLICTAFPQINKAYLFTGEGELVNKTVTPPAPATELPQFLGHDMGALFHRVMDMLDQVNERSAKLLEFEKELIEREAALNARELDLDQREAEMPSLSKLQA